MKSNFEFLMTDDNDLKKYYTNAIHAEKLYSDGY